MPDSRRRFIARSMMTIELSSSTLDYKGEREAGTLRVHLYRLLGEDFFRQSA